jgi:hypothetical protein
MFHQLANIEKDDKIVKPPSDKIIPRKKALKEQRQFYFLNCSPQSGQNL